MKLFERGTYFKYIEILSGDEHLIIDMESLSLCEFTSLEDVDNFTLPSMRKYEGNGAIRIGKIKKANKGILGKKASLNTVERSVYVYSPKAIISLRLLKDARNISTRNGIEFFINRGFYADTGALVRKDVSYSEFGTNYELFKRNTYQIYDDTVDIKDISYINGNAVSYGSLTEENIKEYSYDINVPKSKSKSTSKSIVQYSYEDDSDMQSLLETNTDMMLETSSEYSFVYESDVDTISEASFEYDIELPLVVDLTPKKEVISKKTEHSNMSYDYSETTQDEPIVYTY
jgi:hypothetical protein